MTLAKSKQRARKRAPKNRGNVLPFDKAKQAAGRLAEAAAPADEPVPENVMIAVSAIDQSGDNPRLMAVDDDADAKFVASVKKHGVLQPIRVRPIGSGRYQVVAGGRRYAAAVAAGLTTIPAFVATPTDDQAFQQALVENVQREDLNPIDEAKALMKLAASGLTQKQVAAMIGKSQPYVANAIGLLETAPSVQTALAQGTMTVAAAKAMKSLSSERQEELAARSVAGEVTSKDIESQVAEEKRRAARLALEATEKEAKIEQIGAALKAARADKTLPAGSTVAIDSYTVVNLDDLTVPKGVTVVKRQYDQHHGRGSGDGFDCKCRGWALTFRYGDGESQFSPICVEPEHYAAYRKAIEDEKKERERTAAANLRKLKTELLPSLSASASELSEDGYRLLSYSTLYGRPKEAASFCKKQGVEHPKVDQYDQHAETEPLLEAVMKAPMADVVTWLTGLLVDLYVPDVYRLPKWDLERGLEMRTWLVERFGLSTDLLWGGREKEFGIGDEPEPEPEPDEPVADEQADDSAEQAGLAGETIVVTGVVEGMTRDEVELAITEAGASAGDAVNSRTTLLVIGERPGQAKLMKAAELGIATIDEAEFRLRLDQPRDAAVADQLAEMENAESESATRFGE